MTYKKIFHGFVVTVLLITNSSYALAATSSATINPTTLQERKIDLRNTFETNKQSLADQMKTNRDALHEKIKQAREEYKQKLQTIRDERKKIVVERIDNRISERNKNITDRWNNVIQRLSGFLSGITERANQAKTNRKDITSVNQAIAAAQSAIAAAQLAISDQAAKQYAITITTESALRSTVGTTISQFGSDLKTVHKTIIDARFAVMNAERELAKVRLEVKPTGTAATNSAVVK